TKQMVEAFFADLIYPQFTLSAHSEFISFVGTYMNIFRTFSCVHGIFPKIKEQIIRPFLQWAEFKIRCGYFTQPYILRVFQDKTCMTKSLHQWSNLNMIHPGIAR